MKKTLMLGTIFLLLAGASWAGDVEPALAGLDLGLTLPLEGQLCEAAITLAQAELTSWAQAADAEALGAPVAAAGTSPPSCPPIISCNATHCVETTFCSITDFGSTSCSGHTATNCPPGTTIKVRRCRCAGGGCQVANSQTFFCL